MNILIVTGPYPPEVRSISFMIQQLADDIVQRCHEVTVIACWPRHNLSEEARRKTFNEIADESGVRVIRVKTPPNHGGNYILRGLAQFISPYLFIRKIRKLVKEPVDVVVVYSPPLSYTVVGAWVKKAYGAKYVLNVQDIFPQNAVDLGILRSRLLIRYFEGMEKRAYESADVVTSHTASSGKLLIQNKCLAEDKLRIVPNWIDIEETYGGQQKDFRDAYMLQGKFVLLFAGILGPSQNLDYIIDIASEVADLQDLCFLFVGDGVEKKRIDEKVLRRGLKNVIFKPFIDSSEYPDLVKSVDVGLVSLSMMNKTPVIPGKILGYMAGRLPIVAFLNKESDAHTLLKEACCGFSLIPDDVCKGANLIRDIYRKREELKVYGESGFRYVTAHYSKKACIDMIEELLRV